jgi:hypothetical protein
VKSFRRVVGGKVCFAVSPHSLCPCGSQVPASRCCLTPTGFRKTPARTSPPSPKTGKSLDMCYARALGDCGGGPSREHYISESLLHYLNRDNDLRVSGLPWVKGQERIVPPNALASRMLCNRHNSALSTLDAIAVRLFQAFDEGRAAGSGQQLIHLFSGHDLERWLLKILCGVVSSKSVSVDGEVNLSIPEYWLRILFGEAEFPGEQGLYVCKSRGYRFEGPHGLQLRIIVGRGRLTGMGVWVCGYELILSMSGFPSRVFAGREVAYRPLEFHATGRDFEKSVLLSWEGIADLGTISTSIGGT